MDTATPTARPAWLDLDPEVLARLLSSKPTLHPDDAAALVDAGLYNVEPRHIGGRGNVTHIYPAPILRNAPIWRECVINLSRSYWEQ